MKKFIIIVSCLLLFCGAMFYSLSLPRNLSGLTAERGVLNLTGADFSDTLFALDGEWAFYYGELYEPDDFGSGTPEGGALIEVPMSWHKAGYPLTGFATYRLTVQTAEPDLMLFIPDILHSSIVYMNGQKVFEAGRIGRTAAETAPGLRNAFVTARPEDGQVEIIVQAANYVWAMGGLRYSMTLARPGLLLGDMIARLALLGAVIGLLIAIAIYHIMLFAYSRREWVYLAFTLYCVVVSARLTLETNSFAMLFLPGGMDMGLLYLLRVLLVMQSAGLTLYTHLIFNKPVRMVRGVIYGICFLTPLILFLLMPYDLARYQPVYLSMIPMFMSIVSTARSEHVRKSPSNILYFIALSVFIVWYPLVKLVLNDALYMPVAISNLFLVLCQCFMLSVGYSEARRSAEKLTAHNQLLNKLNRTKTEFLHDMSHEMKVPLTVIATGADFANRKIKKDSGSLTDASAALDSIQDETQRLGRMVDSMVTLVSMSEAGANRKRVDFAALLRSSAEAFRVTLEQYGNRLQVEIASGLPDVFVENDRFTQVIANLLSNAANHTGNSQISLTADCDGGFITVRVTDTGSGIDSELLPRVFERGVSGRKDGTGYGLAICKTVVEAHGGTIEIESGPGNGTAVIFTVPVYGGQEAGHTI